MKKINIYISIIVFILLVLTFTPIKKSFLISKTNFNENIKPGDILFCECKNKDYSIFGWDHCSIYIGNNEFIEAVPDKGVWITNFSVYSTWAKNFRFAYVKGVSEKQRNAAVDFAMSQLDKSYQYKNSSFFHFIGLRKDNSSESKEWYCSELVWAAYYNQGIDIDFNNWFFPRMVNPIDISLDILVSMYKI